MARRIEAAKAQLDSMTAQLDSLSPLAVLGRGYSITERVDTGKVVRSADQLQQGDLIRTKLGRGGAVSRVETVGE